MQRLLIKPLSVLMLALCLTFMPVGHLLASDQGKVTVAAGFSLEPYVLKTGQGIVGSIISESLGLSGFDVDFELKSNMDAIALYEKKLVDGVSVVRKGMVTGAYSVPIVTFNNRVISLEERGIEVSTLDDLEGYRVIAFSNASKYLGKEFRLGIEKTASYEEIARQIEQVRKLFDGEADLIVADETIFEFYRKRLRNQTPTDSKWKKRISLGYRFPPSVYHVAFHEQAHRDAFNRGFEQLRASGRHQQIVDTYLNLLDKY